MMLKFLKRSRKSRDLEELRESFELLIKDMQKISKSFLSEEIEYEILIFEVNYISVDYKIGNIKYNVTTKRIYD